MAKKTRQAKFQLSPEEMNEKKNYLKRHQKKFKVYYGFSKLTKKIVRKRELAIYYENATSFSNLKFIQQKIHIVHERIQTMDEMTDFDIGNRSFTKYGYFIDEKPWCCDIEKILEENFVAEENHVTKKERLDIRDKLRKEYYSFYRIDKKPVGQQSLIFE